MDEDLELFLELGVAEYSACLRTKIKFLTRRDASRQPEGSCFHFILYLLCLASSNYSMIIPINPPVHSKKPETRFPPQLAKLGTDELILIELQGSFQVDGDPSGQLAARLNLENVSNIRYST